MKYLKMTLFTGHHKAEYIFIQQLLNQQLK